MSRPTLPIRPLVPLLLAIIATTSLVSGASTAYGQPTQPASVKMTVNRQRLSQDEELVLKVRFEGQFEAPEFPDLSAFKVIKRSESSESFTQIVNGRVSSTTAKVYTYRLRPLKAGQLVIGQAAARTGGRMVAGAPAIRVTVTKPQQLVPMTATAARDLKRYEGESVFLRASVPRARYVVGEPLPIVWELYIKAGVRVEGYEFSVEPKLDGLLVEELSDPTAQPQVTEARVGRTQYNRVVVREQLATPLKAGTILIDTATMKVAVAERQANSFFTQTKRISRKSQPFHVQVTPVPTAKRPDGYEEGNVGRYKLVAALSGEAGMGPTRARTGQRLVLTLDVTGRGNLVTLKAPRLDASDAFSVQPLPSSGADDSIQKDATGMHGKRTFQYLLSPLVPGKQTTPGATLSYFDPTAGEFRTARADGTPLEVTGQQVSDQTSAAALSGETVGPIFESAALDSGPRAPLTAMPLFWALLALPLLGFLAVEVRYRLQRRHERDPQQRRTRNAYANARKRLRAAEQAQRDGLVKDFYGQIARTLTSYLEERANLPATGMTHEELRTAAQTAGYSGGRDALIVEMENCDFARFAPSGSATGRMKETLERAGALLRQLDQVPLKRRA